MQLLVEIEEQQDLQLLMQLLERLKISYVTLPAQEDGEKRSMKPSAETQRKTLGQKSFDIDEIERLCNELYARKVSEQDLQRIKLLLGQYFADRASDLADEVWKKKQLTEEKILQKHRRTAYRRDPV